MPDELTEILDGMSRDFQRYREELLELRDENAQLRAVLRDALVVVEAHAEEYTIRGTVLADMRRLLQEAP